MKISVLDKGFVELVDTLGSDLTVVNSARVSFGKRKTSFDKQDRALVRYLAKHKHFSPFRHIQAQFHIKAPEFVMRQWYKHVVGIETSSSSSTKDHAWNEISGRYVEVKDFYTPEVFRQQSKDNKQATEGAVEDQESVLQSWKDAHWYANLYYKSLLDAGGGKEQARAILPLSQYTEVYWTASFQGIMNFIELRYEKTAQVEIQVYAEALLKVMEKEFPETTKAWTARNEK